MQTAPNLRRTVNVPLSAPVEWLDKTIASVDIEEPSAATFFEVGPPQMVVHGSVGGSLVDVPDALASYVAKCVKVENAAHLLRVLPLADGRAIKRVILGFFQEESAEATSS